MTQTICEKLARCSTTGEVRRMLRGQIPTQAMVEAGMSVVTKTIETDDPEIYPTEVWRAMTKAMR